MSDIIAGSVSNDPGNTWVNEKMTVVDGCYKEILQKLNIDQSSAPFLKHSGLLDESGKIKELIYYEADRYNRTGGFIKLSTIFLDNCTRDSGVVKALLTHEIGHFLQRKNEASSIEKEDKIAQALYRWHSRIPIPLLLFTWLFGYKYNIRNDEFWYASVVLSIVTPIYMARKSYSFACQRELQCDRLVAQYYPEGMISFFKKDNIENSDTLYNYLMTSLGFATHPTHEQRIAAIESYLDEQKNKK